MWKGKVILMDSQCFWVIVTRDGDGNVVISPHFNKSLTQIMKEEREGSYYDILAAEFWKITKGQTKLGYDIEIIAR